MQFNLKTKKVVLRFLFLGLTVITSSSIFAQDNPDVLLSNPEKTSEKEINQFQKKLNVKLDSLVSKIKKEYNLSGDFLGYQIEFSKDTMVIHQTREFYLQKSSITMEIAKASYDAYLSYQNLIHRLNEHILNKLDKEDQSVFIKNKEQWELYQESQFNLYALATNLTYSGGGTAQSIIYSDLQYQLSRKRAIELFQLLEFFCLRDDF